MTVAEWLRNGRKPPGRAQRGLIVQAAACQRRMSVARAVAWLEDSMSVQDPGASFEHWRRPLENAAAVCVDAAYDRRAVMRRT